MRVLIITLGTSFICFSRLLSQEIPYGREFQVNTGSENEESTNCVAALGNGRFVVCWSKLNLPANRAEIFGQIFGQDGARIGEEFRIDPLIQGYQFLSRVTALHAGGFAVCWQSTPLDGSGWDLFAKIFDASGHAPGQAFRVNSYTISDQERPAMASLADSRIVVCWQSDRQVGPTWSIWGRILDRNGAITENEFAINTNAQGVPSSPAVAALSDGGSVVCWQNYSLDGSWEGISAQLLDPAGNKIGEEFLVNTYKKDGQAAPAVASWGEGFVICWESYAQEAPGNFSLGIFGQRFDHAGNKIGPEFQINSYTENYQWHPAIAPLHDGGFVVAWQSREQDGSGHGIFGQMYDQTGRRQGYEFQINTHIPDWQASPVLAAITPQAFVAGWSSDGQDGSSWGSFAKILPANSLVYAWREFSLISPCNDVTLSTTRPVLVWQQPAAEKEVYAWDITFDLYLDSSFTFQNPRVVRGILDTTHMVADLAPGRTYLWKVLARNAAGDSLWSRQQDWGFYIAPTATTVETRGEILPSEFVLYQNYPNPFNPNTTIRFSLPRAGLVTLRVYNLLGKEVASLIAEHLAAGEHRVRWDAQDLPAGVYCYRLQTGGLVETKKLIVVK